MRLQKVVSWLLTISLTMGSVPTQALAAGVADEVRRASPEVVSHEADDVGEDVSVAVADDVCAAVVDAASVDSSAPVARALMESGVDGASAHASATALMSADDGGTEAGGIPRQADGSNVEALSLWWVTQDTYDNGDADLLYVKPTADERQQVRMRLNYALSGEFDYQAGDVRIHIPDRMFSYRDGEEAGSLVIPYPAAPDASQDFMWEHLDGEYVLTSTRRMSAATKGFIEFAFVDLVPHRLVDMAPSDGFAASIEVTTHYGNLIGLTSNELVAEFDTEQVVDAAYKRVVANGVRWASADEVPAAQRVPGEDEYVVVTWDVYAHHFGNTEFTLDVLDRVADQYGGFVIGATAADEVGTRLYDDVEGGWRKPGTFGHMTVQTAYPGSQFEPDTDYLLKNEVTYTLTEADPTIGDDEQRVTVARAAASVPFRWHMPIFEDPEGHFMMNKIGNDGASGRDSAPYWSRSYSYLSRGYYKGLDVTHRRGFFDNTDDGYGIYPSALNELADGNPVELSYTVESQGYMAPWQVDTTMDIRKADAYGRLPVMMVTYDTDWEQDGRLYLDGGEELEWGVDWRYLAVEFPVRPDIGGLRAVNLDEDGGFVANHAGDGTFEYVPDTDDTHQPTIFLDAYVGGEWKQVATARWTGSGYDFVCLEGAMASGRRILLPDGTQRTRTRVSTTCAYLLYYVRPIVEVMPSEHVSSVVEGLFEATSTPSIGVHNTAAMDAFDSTGTPIVDFHKGGMDELRGYSTEIAVHPTKVGEQDLMDIDFSRHEILIHYTARVEERSLIGERAIYDGAVADGRLVPETRGVWRDLLPEGVYPVMDSIELRDGDTIVDAYTIEDWRGSNRTMLVVEAELTPHLETYEHGSRYDMRLMDVPTLRFDAVYSFEDLRDFGEDVHNVVSFESLAKDEIGNYPDWSGEADDPAGTANIATRTAFLDDVERGLFEDLDESRDTASFVYAGTTTKIDALAAARTSLSKDIQVNNDGRWSQGTYDDHRYVYEGGQYSYRLRTMSDNDTETRDIKVFDALEAFHAGDGNDEADIDAPRWRGYLRSVDLSQLREMGVEPVVYYSTIPELQLSDETDELKANATNTDLTRSDIWVRADGYSGDLDDVRAIAVDCSKRADGTDFVLDEFESISFVVRMQAPSGDDARTYCSQGGVWGLSAHAYNNAYMLCTSVDKGTGVADGDNFVRKDYTKVGIKEHSYAVSKTWVDDRDRDGLRPESVELRLLADGEETGLSCTLCEENGWASVFEHIPYTDALGNKIRYSVAEDEVEGYKFVSSRLGTSLFAINTHEYETTEVTGEKRWVDAEGNIPDSIRVTVLADNVPWETRTVSDDGSGRWAYSFEDLPKYRDHGRLIEWTVEESGQDAAFVATTDGHDLVNTYHPYGDLSVSKVVRGASAEFADRAFPVTVMLSDADGAPVPGSFAWDSDLGASGTMSSGDTLSIRDGETITIREIPQHCAYEVIEADVDGYTLVGDGMVGEIAPNACATAHLENIYHASGSAQIRAAKTLSGRDMENYQFRFELVDDEGHVVHTGANRADGSVTFGSIDYTEADANKTYHYVIREVDRGVGGYSYDEGTYDVTVEVSDLGNGRLRTDTTVRDADGEVVGATPTFDNSYHAEGSLCLRAWKRLFGDALGEGQFEFVVEDAAGARVATAINDAGGNVVSQPIELDETDAGDRRLYVMREVAGTDPKMVYDDSAFGYLVEIVDDGQGHMLTSQEYVAVRRDGDGWSYDEEVDASVPVFVNERVPGELDIEKTVAGEVPEGHEGDEFTFRVRLVGENVPSDISYELEEIEPSGTSPAGVVLPDVLGWLLGTRKAYAADVDEADEETVVSSETYHANGGTFDDGSETYLRTAHAPSARVAVSHTQNISGGVKVSNYGNSWSNANIRGTGRVGADSSAHVVTIPGAESLTVRVEYGGENSAYDWVRIWAGSHPDYKATSGASDPDLVAGRLGGAHGVATYTVEGDTVTFAYASDGSGCGDGFGYFATVMDASAPDDAIAMDAVKVPSRPGHIFEGWNAKADGTGAELVPGDVVGGAAYYAQWLRTELTYDANGGTFADGSATHDLSYEVSDGGPVAVSHTSNVRDDGEKLSDVTSGGNALIVGTDRPTGTGDAHVVRVEGAERLLIDIDYGIPSSSYYGLAVWRGSRPNSSVSTYTDDSVSGNLSGTGHARLMVDGDTATFAYYTNSTSSTTSQTYGYHATVTPMQEASGIDILEDAPTRPGYGFVGWNSEPDGSGGAEPGDDGVLYAQWESTVTTYDANGGAFPGGATTNVVTYDMISRARVSHTANMDDAGVSSGLAAQSGNGYIRGSGRTTSSSLAHVLSIPDAEGTRLTLRYDTGSPSNYVSVIDHRYSTTSSAIAATTPGSLGQIGGRGERTFDIDGGDVTLAWYMGDVGSRGDGYHAVLDYPREAVSGAYAEPVREGYRFMGWDSASDGSDGVSVVSGGTLYAQWEEASLTFDANGGAFADGSVTKDAGNGNAFAYVVAQSDNRNAAGVADYSYREDFDAGHTYDVNVVSVPGAEALQVSLSADVLFYDSVYVIPGRYEGDIVRSGGSTSYPDNVAGQLYKSTSGQAVGYMGTVNDDTVSFGLYGYNGSTQGQGHPNGYRAVVTLPDQPYVQAPTREHYRFVGWNSEPDGSGDPWCDGTGTMYAQWEMLGGECGGVSWAIDDSGTLSFWPTNGVSGTFERPNGGRWPWLKYLTGRVGVKEVRADPGVVGCENMSHFLDVDYAEKNMHPGYTSSNGTVRSVDVSNMDVSGVRSMSYMFARLYSVEDIDIGGWDTSDVGDFSYWLYHGGSGPISIDLSELDLDSADTMSYMFANRGNAHMLDLSVLDTSHVRNMYAMFQEGTFDADDLSAWDVGSVTSMAYMFSRATAKDKDGAAQHTVDLAAWDVGSVTSMSYMFYHWNESDEPICVVVDGWDTGNVTSMASMFRGGNTGAMNPVYCDLSKLDVSSVRDFSYMLYLNDAFKVVDISDWDMSSAASTQYMIGTSSSSNTVSATNHGPRGTVKIVFGDACRLPADNSVALSGQSVDGKWRRIDETDADRVSGDELGKLSREGTGDRERFVGTWVAANMATVAVLDSDGNLTFVTPVEPILEQDSEHTDITVTSVGGTEYTGHVDLDYVSNRSSYRVYLFADQREDVRHVSVDGDSTVAFAYDSGMIAMFDGFSNMESFDGSRFETTGQTSFASLFSGCRSLADVDVTSWDTSSVTNMSNAFYDCRSLPAVDVTSWDTSSVTNMSSMFSQCLGLEEIMGVESLDVGSVSNFRYMFTSCEGIASLDLSGWDTSSATDMYSMFNSMRNLASLNVDGWDTSHVRSMCYSGTGSVGDGMFGYCRSLTSLDLSSWDVSNVNSFTGMFYYCTSLEELDISGFSNMGDSKSRYRMFAGDSKLSSVTLGEGFDFVGTIRNTTDQAILPTPPISTTTGRWVNLEKDATAALTPEELRDSYDGSDESMVGTWVWELAQRLFSFDANGGMGRMDDYGVTRGVTGKLPACAFTMFDHDFVGWNSEPDGSGESFDDEATVSHTANEWQRVRLYAQWRQREHTVDVDDGTFEVTIPAGYRIRIADLPAGTSYVVTEVSTSRPGWQVSDSANASGEVVSDETVCARFENRYVPDEARAVPMAYKTLDGLVPQPGSFTFCLLDGEGAVVDEETCGVGGAVTFDELVFDEVGEHDYRIVEVAGADEAIDYDAREVAVHVSVTERDGALSARMTYDGTEVAPTFANTHKPGELMVSKVVDGSRAAGADDSFDVVVVCTGPDGLPLSSVRVEGEDEVRTSDTGTYVLSLTGGESARLVGLPAHARWSVSEPNVGVGWALSGITNATGEVESGVCVESVVSNTYSAHGEATIQAHKRLVGRGIASGEFGFELLDADGDVIERVWSGAVDERETVAGADGETEVANPYLGSAPVTFTALRYEEPGTYRYTVREVAGEDETVIYSDEVLAVTVEVTDIGRGQLACDVSFDGGADTFENVVRTGSLVIEKHVVGATEAAGGARFDMTLELADASGAPVADGSYDGRLMPDSGPAQAVSVAVSGGVAHVSLGGGESLLVTGLAHGTRYRVFESALEPCWSVVSESATTGSVIADDEVRASITNGYATSGTFSLSASKSVVDLGLADGDYRFDVRDEDGRVIASATNVGGSVSFDGIGIDPSWAGATKSFHVSERAGSDASILYDDHVEDVSVTFADDGHGHLSGVATYDADGCAFENVHNPGWLRVDKRSAVDGIVGDGAYGLGGATFEVLDATGVVVATLTSGADGLTEEVELEPGPYTVRETAAPEGFVINTSYARVQVVGGGHVSAVVVDEPLRGAVGITKRSADPSATTGNPEYDLGGATYAVFASEESARAALAAALAGTYEGGDFEPVAEVELVANDGNTEATGVAEGLLMGTYWVVEVAGGTRYAIADEVWEVAVTGDGTYPIGEGGIVYDMPDSGFLMLEKLLAV